MDDATRVTFEGHRGTARKCCEDMNALQAEEMEVVAKINALQARYGELKQQYGKSKQMLYHAYVGLVDLRNEEKNGQVIEDAIAVVDGYLGDLGIDPPALP